MVVKQCHRAGLCPGSLRVVLSHMVVKQEEDESAEDDEFESSVISYGSQTRRHPTAPE